MRIAIVVPTIDEIGGAERQVLMLATELVVRGHTTTLIALSGSGSESVGKLADAGVAFLSLGMRKAWIDPQGWFRYLDWYGENQPEIVHAHLAHAAWFCRCVRLLAPVRVVVSTFHTTRAGSRFQQMGFRLTHWLTDHVLCVSAAVADSVLARRMALREHLSILANGVALPEPVGQAEASPPRCFRWIAVGRLAPVKDYPTLLRAFAALAGEPTLRIAGSGPDESSLRELAAQLGIDGRVHFAGFQSDIQPLLAASDALVLSSLWEGLPVVLLEAAAASLPVVATDGKGTREAMLPGKSGLLVPVGDVAGLARAMAAVMAMPSELSKEMGACGRQLVRDQFALPVIVDKLEALYRQLLAVNPKPKRWRG